MTRELGVYFHTGAVYMAPKTIVLYCTVSVLYRTYFVYQCTRKNTFNTVVPKLYYNNIIPNLAPPDYIKLVWYSYNITLLGSRIFQFQKQKSTD